ncbi:MAG: TSUP family transporter, partial [Roseiarcus sp.]
MSLLSPLAFLLLVAAALVAGFVDAIAGGGGLITVPFLSLAGLDPVSVIATNKLQSSFGAGSAMQTYARAGHVEWRKAPLLALLAALGAVAGATLVSHLPLNWLAAALPGALVAIAIYFALSPQIADVATRPRMGATSFKLTIIPLIGCYDGMFGPGAGSFYMLG